MRLLVILILILVSPQGLSTQVGLWVPVKKFSELWNECIEKRNNGIVDIKVCKKVNEAWKEVYNHEDWVK